MVWHYGDFLVVGEIKKLLEITVYPMDCSN